MAARLEQRPPPLPPEKTVTNKPLRKQEVRNIQRMLPRVTPSPITGSKTRRNFIEDPVSDVWDRITGRHPQYRQLLAT